jgi:hypothetical protein
MGMPELEIYSMIGAEGFARLVAAFYRQVPQDDLLGPIYPASDLPGAEQRLRDFLIGRFGGPQTYIEQRGLNPEPVPIHRLPSRAPRSAKMADDDNSFPLVGFHGTNRTPSKRMSPICVPIHK